MTWHAVEAIDEALEDTKDMLLPFDLGLWTKLAVIAVLTGGVGAPNFFMPGGYTDTGSTDYGTQSTSQMSMSDMNMNSLTGAAVAGDVAVSAFVLGAVAFVSVLVLVMFYVSSVFEFIYYQSLIEGDVKILDYFSDNTRRGLGYFSFRIVFSIAIIMSILAAVALGMINPLLIIFVLLAGLPLLLLVGVFSTLVHDFALVDMLKQDTGIVDAIQKVIEQASEEWKQFGMYVLLKFVIGAAVGMATVMFALFSLLFVALPFALIGIAASMIFEPLIILVILAGALTWLALLLYVVTVPAKTFVYFYSLNVYSRLFE